MNIVEPASRRGFYLAVDGPDGIGKSTLVEHVKASLTEAGCSVVVKTEPERDGPLWPAIRDYRLSGEYPDEVWSLVLAAASIGAQRRTGGTLDLLSADIWVVTDRSPLSVFAHYWGDVGQQLHQALISRFVPPDLLVFLRPKDPEILRRRLCNRGEPEEDIERTIGMGRNYFLAATWLAKLGWQVAILDVSDDVTTEALWWAVRERLPLSVE